LEEANRLEFPLQARVTDPNDPMNDYEIEASIYYILQENDPDFDECEDNFLTTRRYISLKEIRKRYLVLRWQ
jgi:hypothetical protein